VPIQSDQNAYAGRERVVPQCDGRFCDRRSGSHHRTSGAVPIAPRRDAIISHKQKLVVGLFDRLAKPENASRDREAERLIAGGTGQAPHAADTPDDLNTDDDSYFADDDTWIE